MTSSLTELIRHGQSFWYDNIRRSMLVSGELAHLVEVDGLRGLTSNPTIFDKAIGASSDYDDAIGDAVADGLDPEAIFFRLAVDDIRGAADILAPVYVESEGADGYASLELPPSLAHDTAGSIAAAKDLFARLDRPNVMVKVPGTAEGLPAFTELIASGVNVNVTLLFSCDGYEQVAEAYIAGLEGLAERGGDLSSVASVASFFVSRVDKVCDAVLEEQGRLDLLGTVGIANAKDAYQRFLRIFSSPRFEALRTRGARVQRCLWASTSTKDPRLSDVLYVENLIGPDTVNTLPEATVDAFRDHGRAKPTLTEGVDEALALLAQLPGFGIDLDEVTSQLQRDGVAAFAADFERLIDRLAQRRQSAQVVALEGVRRRSARLGDIAREVDAALGRAAADDAARRLWEGDATLWSDEPEHKEIISNRLGWLSVHERMEHQLDPLRAFADEVRTDGIAHVVLLGMGGSSLAPEVMRTMFGPAPGCPELLVLDSTDPRQVAAVAQAIDLHRSLFLFASKSGTTLEPDALYRHFRGLVDDGSRFVAITDPHTELEARAERDGFRRVFLNPADIGGRYSALSYFGLVPAALTGLDLDALLDGVRDIATASARSVPADDNAGLWLGCAIGAAARAGRDKLTLVCPPGWESFGLWVEQLVAESTGKQGVGIVPVAGEPLGPPEVYGGDRLFLALRSPSDRFDHQLDALAGAGHPVIELFVDSPHDLGREFWRFEFATAVAGWVLAIDPFDEPNVAEAKAATNAILEGGELPDVPVGTVADAVDQLKAGDYFAVLAYLPYRPEVEAAATALRLRVREQKRVATTFGYGPRYLHSTGQLHKGGPGTGVFLLVTAGQDESGFGRIQLAQALGDYQTLRAHGRRVVRVHLADPADLAHLP